MSFSHFWTKHKREKTTGIQPEKPNPDHHASSTSTALGLLSSRALSSVMTRNDPGFEKKMSRQQSPLVLSQKTRNVLPMCPDQSVTYVTERTKRILYPTQAHILYFTRHIL